MRRRSVIGVIACALATLAVWASPAVAQAATAKIHVVAGTDTDAIVLESVRDDGSRVFGMVDSGEDADYPDGSDPRYPHRSGISVGRGIDDKVLAYLDKIGVTHDNLEFYLGTHPHSDHIGSADEVIRKYRPKRVYLMPYNDGCVTDPNRLWDNLYVYDHAVAAANDTGADLIQSFDPALPAGEVTAASGEDTSLAASPRFSLGAMDIEVVNYDQDYLKHPRHDANDFSLGVIVKANGHKAFLAGDISDIDGDETRLAPVVGKVDVLKVGHHGWTDSSTPAFMGALQPSLLVMTAPLRTITPSNDLLDYLARSGTRLLDTGTARDQGLPAVVVDLAGAVVSARWPSGLDTSYARDTTPRYVSMRDGYLLPRNGWHTASNGRRYYFEQSPFPVESRWVRDAEGTKWLGADGAMACGWSRVDDGQWHLFGPTGLQLTGWQKVGGSWYYLDPATGAMRTGWLASGGRWYWLDPESGAMATGWAQVGGKWYWLRPAGSPSGPEGSMGCGWLNDGGRWYYLTGSGAMATGWAQVGGRWYYLSGSGAMATGWQRVGGHWYYLDAAAGGAMRTGWLDDGGRWYYLSGSGAMVTGTRVIDGRVYRFNGSGALVS